MIRIEKTDSANKDFQRLIVSLNKDLALINGDDDDFFMQLNTTHDIKNVVLAYDNEIPVGCGAFKKYDADSVEIKRMFVKHDYRQKGISKLLLLALEAWAAELYYKKCVLETSVELQPAVNLYKRSGYSEIAKYEPYVNVEASICMAKNIQ